MKRRTILLIPAFLIIVVALCAISNLLLPRRSKLVDTLSAEEKARAAEAIRLRQELGNQAWPGFGDAAIPLVLYNEENAFLVSYHGEPPVGWVVPRSSEQRGTTWEQVTGDDFFGTPYYRQALAEGVTPQAFTVRLGDQWAASMTTLEWTRIKLAQTMREEMPSWLGPIVPYSLVTRLFIGDSDKYISALTHESFHAFVGLQSERHLVQAEEVALSQEEAYPWEDQTVVSGWQTELALLTQAVRASSRDETISLASQFLAARQERRVAVRLASRLIDYEQRREWLEGMAKYMELELWRQGSTAREYSAHPATQALGDFHDYGGYEDAWGREVDQMARMADDRGDGRFYYSGMAQAVLLDRLLPGWKTGALTGGTTLEGLLDAAVNGDIRFDAEAP
jgi:hypothetical protein